MYKKKELYKSLAAIIALVAIMKVSGGAGFVVVIPFALVALAQRRPVSLLFWVLMCTSMLMANGNIVSKDAIFAISQRALLVVVGFVSILQMSGHGISPIAKSFVIMYSYVFFMIVPSLFGWNPQISLLKLFLFAMIYSAYLGVANNAARHNSLYASRRLRAVVLAMAIFFVFGSIALVPFPGLSQMKAEDFLENPELTSLFTGMTNHSQALGPLISSISVFLFADLLFSIRKFDKLYIGLLLCCPYLIYKTSSRTGMGAFLLGMGFVVWQFMNARGMSSRWKAKVMNSVSMMVLGGIVAILAVPSIQAKATRFILKWQGEEKVSVQKVILARQGKFESAIDNFARSPIVGNGFQVMESQKGMKGGMLILSAPIEKGVWISAVLEEGGAIGFAIFIIFLFACIVGSVKKRAYVTASCLFVAMLTNLGEFTFFSMTYTGGFIWAMVFTGIAMDAQRLKEQGRMRILEEQMRMQQIR